MQEYYGGGTLAQAGRLASSSSYPNERDPLREAYSNSI